MRNRWLLVVVAVASLALNLAVVGAYFYRARHRRHHSRFPHMRHADAERMERIRDQAIPGFESLMSRTESVSTMLMSRIGDPKITRPEVESLCREVGRYHGEMRERMFWQVRSELESLPPERRAEYMEQFKSGMRHMMRGSRHRRSRDWGSPPDHGR